MIRSSRKYVIGGTALVLVALVALIASAAVESHHLAKERKSRATENAKGPVVLVTTAESSPVFRDITLIGESRPYAESTLYAKVSGYLRDITVDKGDQVQAGQRIAVIESPETDKAYLSALADYRNKHAIALRYRVLLRKKLISQQEADQIFANDKMASAFLQQQKTLKDYENVIVPFPGTVTSRYVDPGALIQAATGSQAGAQAVITVSTIDRLRVFFYVDQKDASFVKAGVPVQIWLRETPDDRIAARVTRTAGTLDPKTRTLLSEVDMPNTAKKIVPGSYVEVTVRVPSEPAVAIPARALVLQKEKPVVPVVDDGNAVHFRPVKILNNDGEEVQISEGLQAGERIAVSLGNTVNEGQKIQPRPLEEQHRMAGMASPVPWSSPSPSSSPSRRSSK